jgi:hypothetical protein
VSNRQLRQPVRYSDRKTHSRRTLRGAHCRRQLIAQFKDLVGLTHHQRPRVGQRHPATRRLEKDALERALEL